MPRAGRFRGDPGGPERVALEAGGPWGAPPRSRKSSRPCQRRAWPSLPPSASRWSLDSLPLRRPRRRSLPGSPLPSPRPWGAWGWPGPRGGRAPAGPVAPGRCRRVSGAFLGPCHPVPASRNGGHPGPGLRACAGRRAGPAGLRPAWPWLLSLSPTVEL